VHDLPGRVRAVVAGIDRHVHLRQLSHRREVAVDEDDHFGWINIVATRERSQRQQRTEKSSRHGGPLVGARASLLCIGSRASDRVAGYACSWPAMYLPTSAGCVFSGVVSNTIAPSNITHSR